MLSGLQHFSFCRRQWALIHLEDQWQENLRTVEGNLLHERAHDETQTEKRKDLLIVRGLRVHSFALGVSGSCDVVEFHANPQGVPLHGYEGRWRAFPVEYKRGQSKQNDADRLQLCGQALCLEEMLGTEIPTAALFYATPHRREIVELTPELREKTRAMLMEMHDLYRRGHTPKVKTGAFCKACSLQEVCLPKLCRPVSGKAYLARRLEEELDETSAQHTVCDQ